MKYIVLGVIFMAMPYVLLSIFVMPAMRSLQNTYSNADHIANQAAYGSTRYR